MEPEIVQRFLESVGAKADIDLYLKLFRAQRKESFAIIAADAQIVKNALDPVHFDLRILAGLGLVPVVLLGLLEPKDADARRCACRSGWSRTRSPARSSRAGVDAGGASAADSVAAVRATIARGEIPLRLAGGRQGRADRGALPPARVAGRGAGDAQGHLPQPAPGARRPTAAPPLSVVNLATDYDRLLAPGAACRAARRCCCARSSSCSRACRTG